MTQIAEPSESPRGVRRRTVLLTAAAGTGALAVGSTVLTRADAAIIGGVTASSRTVYNMNIDWKFIQADVSGASAASFNDAPWTTVSVPHTYNDVDSFDDYIGTSGETAVAMQITWYRKRFTLPASQAGSKVLIEFEGIRQAATVFVNGTQVGLYEAGVTPFGFDITNAVRFGAENVIAVKADNTKWRPEQATGVTYQWDSRDFNPTYGGLTRDVRLYVLPRTYFTLPLYSNLRTVGTYVYATNHSVSGRTATITAEAQIRNEQTNARTLTVSANLINAAGEVVQTFTAPAVTLGAGQTQIVRVSGAASNLTFWSVENPYLYTVEMVLREGSTVHDAYPIVTGFRKTEFRGGATNGGVYLNDRYIWLSGYAQRSTHEWAILGGAVPEWLRNYDGAMIRDSNANLMRWMHLAATPSDIRSTDRYGIVSIQPAGDKEADVTDRKWEHRVEAMRDTIIYFRNNPSILFWEAGNQWISAPHMREMTALRRTWDPSGGRVMGCRSITDNTGYSGPASVDAAEWTGTMLNRHYSVYARDRMPIIELEYSRDEAPRRVWDNYSPPDFGYKTGPDVTWHLTSEDIAATVAASTRWEFWGQRIQGPGGADSRRYSGAAGLIWSDSNQHGRQYGWETSRLSGRVDAVRIPKEYFFSFKVMQSPRPAIHIIGHWTYPANTTKTMYVMGSSHVRRVQLLVNGVQVGNDTAATQDFLYSFPNVRWAAGTITAVGYDAAGQEIIRTSKVTAGPPAALKLTTTTAPGGLRADGVDVFLIDVEAVDAQGRRCPTDQARVDFTISGPGRFLGGYNPGKPGSVFKSYVDTEAGINRVFVRATRTAGAITVRATRSGLTAASVTVSSKAFAITGGLTTEYPDGYGDVGPKVTPTATTPPVTSEPPQPTGTFSIVNRRTSKVLGVTDASAANGATVTQQTDTGAAHQRWQRVDVGGGYFKLVNVGSGKAMDVVNRLLTDGAAVVQWTDNGGTNQQWQEVAVDGGFVKVINRNSGKVLDLFEGAAADGTAIIQWIDNGRTNQHWQFVAR
ncbi:MAG TPA: RICIN domain-containing protein [Micromonosporaceae bacterium]|nr:RICIN domain-containing protein [Micromonosporaceae bacterium]